MVVVGGDYRRLAVAHSGRHVGPHMTSMVSGMIVPSWLRVPNGPVRAGARSPRSRKSRNSLNTRWRVQNLQTQARPHVALRIAVEGTGTEHAADAVQQVRIRHRPDSPRIHVAPTRPERAFVDGSMRDFPNRPTRA